MNNIFSKACSSDFLVPDYFETSLKEIEACKVSKVKFEGSNKVVYVAKDDNGGGLESWATGPIAGIVGLIVLLMGIVDGGARVSTCKYSIKNKSSI